MSTGDDNELALMTLAALAALLGRSRQTVGRLVDSGEIPVAYIDEDTGERYFTKAVLAAQQRRSGELHAEEAAAERARLNGRSPVPQPDTKTADADDGRSVARHYDGDHAWSLDRTLDAAIAKRNAAQYRAPEPQHQPEEVSGPRRSRGHGSA